MSNEPKLAPPGAGLPTTELLIARMLFAVRRRTGSRRSFEARFINERQRVQTLVAACDSATGAQRVLIKRPVGLEDSSRNWSVWMTLDHLRIVHLALARTIRALTAGLVPDGKADTAAVKPGADATAEVVGPYERSCDAVLSAVAAVTDLNTTAKFAHPWFGPLDASGWQALSGMHLGIHRVQIERILAGLHGSGIR